MTDNKRRHPGLLADFQLQYIGVDPGTDDHVAVIVMKDGSIEAMICTPARKVEKVTSND
jgi:hypothetical protein